MTDNWQYWAEVYRLIALAMETLSVADDQTDEVNVSVAKYQLRNMRITALLLKVELRDELEPGSAERFKNLWRAELSAASEIVRFLVVDIMQEAEKYAKDMQEIPF